MRFDVNVSVSQTNELGTRTETKNINSFRAVEKVVEYEVSRQIEVLEKGGPIVQETRGWDDAKQRTFSQRLKENADDYRYMPDPDLPPIVLDEAYVAAIKAEMPVMPDEWRSRLSSLGLSKSQIDTLIDAQVEHSQEHYLELLEAVLGDMALAKQLANWLVNIDVPYVREHESETRPFDRQALYTAVSGLAADGKLSSTGAKALIADLLATATLPADIAAYAQSKGLVQESDEGAIAEIVKQVVAENPQAAEDVKSGEMKAIGFLVGQVMKLSQGKANPSLARQLIKKQLDS